MVCESIEADWDEGGGGLHRCRVCGGNGFECVLGVVYDQLGEELHVCLLFMSA